MKTRTLTALAAATAATLACAAPAVAATPFSGPTTGSGWDLAVGADGTATPRGSPKRPGTGCKRKG
jgi:opacity protein-like surface antigen